MSFSTALISLAAEARTVPVRVVEVRTDTGFDWGDAAIGATATVALGAIAYGAALARRGLLGCIAALAVLVLTSATYLVIT